MKCPHCRHAVLQRVSETVTKLRLKGPITLNPANHTLSSQCFWCQGPVLLQAFLPEIQLTEAPGAK